MTASTAIAALQGALAAEHAAVYGYGVVGAMLAGPGQADARADWLAHQVARDTLEAMLTRLGATPVAASPAYRLPFAVTGTASAQRLAATLEEGVTRAYLGLVAVNNPALRTLGARAMQTSANRATAWSGITVAFPGLQGLCRNLSDYVMPNNEMSWAVEWPADNTVRGRERTRVIVVADESRSSAIEMRSAQDHQNHHRPSLPQSA